MPWNGLGIVYIIRCLLLVQLRETHTDTTGQNVDWDVHVQVKNQTKQAVPWRLLCPEQFLIVMSDFQLGGFVQDVLIGLVIRVRMSQSKHMLCQIAG